MMIFDDDGVPLCLWKRDAIPEEDTFSVCSFEDVSMLVHISTTERLIVILLVL